MKLLLGLLALVFVTANGTIPQPECKLDADTFVCPELVNGGSGSPLEGEESCCSSVLKQRSPYFQNCGGTRPTGLPFAGRSPVYAQNGMAATSQPLSTQAAIDILKAGGSAVDAAIAANAMEGVVEPYMNGMGGDLMAIVYDPKTGKAQGLNSSGRSSKKVDLAAMLDRLGELTPPLNMIPSTGPLSVTVPGAVMGWCMLHERFGKLDFADLLAPAIKYAEEGFPVSEVIASGWGLVANSSALTSSGRYPNAIDGFLNTFAIKDDETGEYRAPRAGEIWKNPDLANSLRKVAIGGCHEFYNGTISRAIDAFREQAGLLIDYEDMQQHHSQWIDPVNVTYRERYTVLELPPNPQGLAALQQLNILETMDLKSMGHNSADYLHAHIESKKLAFADRAKYYADPDFYNVPIEWLLSKEYAAQRAQMINMSSAAESVPAGIQTSHNRTNLMTANEQSGPPGGDTIYLTTADGDGMMVSLIQSNFNGFGSGLVVPGLGFALQDRGSLYDVMHADAANVYAADKRPFHTIIPGFVLQDDLPWLSFGVMGGNMQPQGHAQILTNIIDFGMNVQEAGDAARYYHSGSSQPTGTVMTDGGSVQLEAGVCSSVRADLESRGHVLTLGPNGGGYQAIMRDHREQKAAPGALVYHGASEMRKDGYAAGF